jgi:predicted PurR-regulated permease PerM
MSAEMTRFVRRAVAAVLIVGLVALLAYAIELILYVFSGILLALMLRTAGMWLTSATGISIRWCMTIVLAAFVMAVFGTVWIFGLHIMNQADLLFVHLHGLFGVPKQTSAIPHFQAARINHTLR